MRELEIKIKDDICERTGVAIDRVSCYLSKDKDIHVHGSISWETAQESFVGVKASLCNAKGQILYELKDYSDIALDICGYNTFSMYCGNVSRFLEINQLTYIEVFPCIKIKPKDI